MVRAAPHRMCGPGAPRRRFEPLFVRRGAWWSSVERPQASIHSRGRHVHSLPVTYKWYLVIIIIINIINIINNQQPRN